MNETVLSICSTCRDGDENLKKSGGQLLLENIIAYFNYKKLPFLKLREVRCMSQCKRSCVISFTSNNCFTYVFGDIDPKDPQYIRSLFDLLISYGKAEEGFLRRRDRPELFKSNILGRLPAIESKSSIISKI
tara:strand:+ start:60 stop:455 length:396 start_codon:yes stop_codon:yes gene_type:complete